jgi:ubiquinone/menaquinone biosynthesis C-methylase UbiE
MTRMAELLPEVLEHYEHHYDEVDRLSEVGANGLEFLRTQDVIARHAPAPPARAIDVGGGPGAYAAWLAERGYDVRLVDPVPRHVAQARARAEGRFEAVRGDARTLAEPDRSADLVLLLGPLYHLTSRPHRLAALAEARRVLRPGGVLIAAAISRFASMYDGLRRGWIDDPDFTAIVDRDLRDGQHRNPDGRSGWFTTAYFHHPDELATEVRGAGLALDSVVSVEGTAWLLPELPAILAADGSRARLLDLLRRTEAEPTMLGATSHLLAIAHR